MRRRTALMLTALSVAVVASGCSGGSDDPEVLGVVVERSPSASAAPTPTVTTSSAAPTASRPAPAVDGGGLAVRTADTPPDEPTTPAARSTPSEPSAATPTAAEPATLAAGPGNTHTWTPLDPPEEGFWWMEASSLPAQDDDGEPWNGTRVRAVDVPAPAPGDDPGKHPERQATCRPWVEAPADRPVRGEGSVTVRLSVNGAVVAEVVHPFDAEVPAGGQHALGDVGSVTVDAREGDELTCAVRFYPA